MQKNKVIQMKPQNDNMKQRIYAAKEQADADLAAKIEKAKQPGVDVRELFTPEEITAMMERNESFHGTVADFSKKQKYDKLVAAARWMDANSFEVIGIQIEPISKDRPNAIVCLDVRRLSSYRGEELNALATMISMSDSVFMAWSETCIRLTFGIQDIWSD